MPAIGHSDVEATDAIVRFNDMQHSFIGKAMHAGHTKKEIESFLVWKAEPIRIRYEKRNFPPGQREDRPLDLSDLHVPNKAKRTKLLRLLQEFVDGMSLQERDAFVSQAGALIHYRSIKPRN